MVTTRDGQSGLTLVEVLVSLSLFLVALMLFGGSLLAAQNMQTRGGQYSRTSDQVYLALQEIDRQIRSGYVASVLGPGAAPSGSTYAVKLFSQADGTPSCIVWAVGPSGSTSSLWTKRWSPGDAMPSSVSGWRLVATDLWNFVPPNNVVPFTVSNLGGSVLKSLDVSLLVNAGSRVAATVQIDSTYTSRNMPRVDNIQGKQESLKDGTLIGDACGS